MRRVKFISIHDTKNNCQQNGLKLVEIRKRRRRLFQLQERLCQQFFGTTKKFYCLPFVWQVKQIILISTVIFWTSWMQNVVKKDVVNSTKKSFSIKTQNSRNHRKYHRIKVRIGWTYTYSPDLVRSDYYLLRNLKKITIWKAFYIKWRSH